MSHRKLSNSKDRFVVASHRSWNSTLADKLTEKTGSQFVLINNPDSLKIELLKEISPKYIFFPHWSYRIPEEIFLEFECIIFHMTDLPFGRGGSPLQNLIQRKIYETKITALRCTKEIDAGPVYLKHPLSLYGSAEEIFIRASQAIEGMIIQIITQDITPLPQEGEPLTFKRRKPEQGNLCNVDSLEEAFDLIRMLDAEGYPPAFLEIGHLKFEFTRGSLKTDCVLADVRITLREE
jgi:methionyl-tRNA formyltransferase